MKALYVLGLVYLGLVVALYLFQRKLQYFPDKTRVAPAYFGLTNVEEVSFDTEDGESLIAWYAQAQGDRPTFVYFHGNAGAVQNRWERVKLLTDFGYGILLVSYRGYGASTGTPTEAGLHLDGRAALRFLEVKGLEPRHLVYFGESLGSGVVVPLAVLKPPAAVVLDSPFTSAADIGQSAYWFAPVRLLMKDTFDNMMHLDRLVSPVFVFHGDSDRVVPISFGRRLFEAIKAPKEFVTIYGAGHVHPINGETWQRMHAFLEKHAHPN